MKEKTELSEIVLKVCNDHRDKSVDEIIKLDTEVCAENGLDSLALMNVLIDLEGILNISFDDLIIRIFEAKTVDDICNLLDKEYFEYTFNN